MKLPHLLPLLALSTLALTSTVSCSRPQTPLGKILNAIKTGSPAEAEAARENGISVVLQEMPTIEKETATICSALKDPDPYIRLQASAVLVAILTTAPIHSGVVSSCTPGLLAAVNDSDLQVRRNVLYALALNLSGPPPALAHGAFVQALSSADSDISQLGAMGLLREEGANREANLRLIGSALQAASDSDHRLSILKAIAAIKVISDDLAQLAEKSVSDPDFNTQFAAVDAVCSAPSDKAKARTFLQHLEASADTSLQLKQFIKGALFQLNLKSGMKE